MSGTFGSCVAEHRTPRKLGHRARHSLSIGSIAAPCFARSAARTSSHLLTAVDGELKKHRSVREQQMRLEKSAIRGLDDDSDDDALDLAEAEKAVGLAPGGAGSAELSEVRQELEVLSERMAAFERTVEGKLDALMAAVRVGGS